MKYINTRYKLFLESVQKDDSDNVNKYEIVQFNENYIIENVYGIDREISINVTKGDKMKLYFDQEKSNSDTYHITAVRPIDTLHNEAKKNVAKKSTKTNFNLSELWEANFVLNNPIVINKSSSPFTIEKYI